MKKRLSAVLFSVVFVLAGLEVGLRVLSPFKQAGKSPDNILWQADSNIGFSPAAGLDTIVYSAEWKNYIKTNEFGFRTVAVMPVIKRPASNSILFLGDSQTMAVQVPAESTFVALIDRELVRRSLSWRTINAGCNGFNTVQEYLFFRKLYDQGFRPRIVVIFVVNNDLYEDVDELPYGRYTIDRTGYVIPQLPDPHSVDQLLKAKELRQPQANFGLRYSALLRTVWYSYRLFQRPYDVVNWIKLSYLRDDIDPFAQRRWAAALAAVRTLNQLVSSYGGRLIIAVNPDPVEWSDEYFAKLKELAPELSDQIYRMKYQRGYRRVAEEVGVSFIDMLKAFPRISVRDFRFAMDPHANTSGHRIIAQQLLKGLEGTGVLHSPTANEVSAEGKTTNPKRINLAS